MSNLPNLVRGRFWTSTSLRKLCTPLTTCCVLRKSVSTGTKSRKLSSEHTQSADDYELAYTFPYIRVAATVNRLKLYQTFVSGAAIPLSFALQSAGVIPLEAALPVAAVSVTSAAALYVAGFFCTDMVGRIWVSRAAEKPQVRVASVGFWGGRAELHLPAHDLLPLAELPDRPTALYVSLRRYSDPAARLKLSLRFGRVENTPAFRKALGHAPF